MSEPESLHYVTPTYQGTLNMAIQTVLSRFTVGSIAGSWIATETLYTILPEKVKAEVKEEYETLTRAMRLIQQRAHLKTYDQLIQNANMTSNMNDFLLHHNRLFFEHIMVALDKGGYLEKASKRLGKDDFQNLEKTQQ